MKKEVNSSATNECKLITSDDGFISCDITECCKIGPITDENYCPRCGNKIIRINKQENQ